MRAHGEICDQRSMPQTVRRRAVLSRVKCYKEDDPHLHDVWRVDTDVEAHDECHAHRLHALLGSPRRALGEPSLFVVGLGVVTIFAEVHDDAVLDAVHLDEDGTLVDV
jgi:hypothetical protein